MGYPGACLQYQVVSLGERANQLQLWAKQQLDWDDVALVPASGDASFRRYFRVQKDDCSYILMDAPPEQEDCRPFVQITGLFLNIGLHVPEIHAQDLDRGFLLLSDLGSRLYLDELGDDTVERLYGDALGALATLQSLGPRETELPPYDQALLMTEMGLFRDWLLNKHLGIQLEESEIEVLQRGFDLLADNALQQPRVCVHRDYHSRNLMCAERHNPGILDYQDAVIGPLTYDLVSLLRDCYITWPRQRVENWALGYYELALQSGVFHPDEADEKIFLRWFDWMGVQRHLKAAGIFARLNHRDGKSGYLKDIPRTLAYVEDICRCYPELVGLGGIVQRVTERFSD